MFGADRQISSILASLHLKPVKPRIKFEILLTYKVSKGTHSTILSEQSTQYQAADLLMFLRVCE